MFRPTIHPELLAFPQELLMLHQELLTFRMFHWQELQKFHWETGKSLAKAQLVTKYNRSQV